MSNKNFFPRMLGRFGWKPSPAGEKSSRRTLRSIPSGDGFEEFLTDRGCSSPVYGAPPSMRGLRTLFQEADSGAPCGLVAFARKMLESDPAAAAHLQTRIFAVLACDWSVSGEDASKAREAEEILHASGIHFLLKHLLEALLFGFSGAAILWEKGGGSIREFRPVDASNWVFDLCGNPALVTLDGKEKPLSGYDPHQFIFLSQNGASGMPSRGGLVRPLAWLYFFKYYAFRDRARYLERFGIPFIAAKVRNEDFESEETRAELMKGLAKLGSDGVGLLNEDAEMQIVSASGNSSGDYQAWLDHLDRLSALLVLGQTATSSDASGFSRGQIQENVRRDLIEADCRALMECIQRDVLAPLELFRWGTEGTLHFLLDYAAPESLLERAAIVEKLSAAGLRIDREWAARTFGVQLEKICRTDS